MALDILTLTVGQLQENCYIVIDKSSRGAVIIDPGDAADFIFQRIRDISCKPQYIIATHGHFDHLMAVTELAAAFGIPFLIHTRDEFLVTNLRSSARHFIGTDPGPIPKIDRFIKEGEKLHIGSISFEVLETPGHTPGSVCLYSQKEAVLFCGDTIFARGGVGRTDFSYSDKRALDHSLQRICALPCATRLYPGHGVSSDISHERLFHV